MQITLPKNNLYDNEQTVLFEKVTLLIGENGAGKSSILQSMFNSRLLKKGALQDKKVVCFSSGQNEKYSRYFSEYLAKERQANRGLNLGCCYYDKSWSSLLIFIATMIKKARVRTFLANKNYIDQSKDEKDDLTSTLKVSIRVERPYVNRVQEALREEEQGNSKTFRTSGYHQTLESFIHTIIDDTYEFDTPLRTQTISLNFGNFFKPSYANPDENFFEPIITFFTQGADNNYFFDRSSIQLILKDDLTLNDLSDGEYQLLFIYSLLDLFDSKDTFFLLDEVDSHLHYKNIVNLWYALHNIQGYTLTTTHLLESITDQLNKINNLKIVDKGMIEEEKKLKAILDRLSNLTRIESTHFTICAKVEHLVLMDDENDWLIFLALAERKGKNISNLSCVEAFKKTSSYGSSNEKLGKQKLDWSSDLLSSVKERSTKNLFLICDRDNAYIEHKKDGVSVEDREAKKTTSSLRNKYGVNVHLLAWKRREIKNYLLSYTALSNSDLLDRINNNDIARNDYLKVNDPADNESIRMLDVKTLFADIINTKGIGLDKIKLSSYINQIPESEISEDIANMYEFIIKEINSGKSS